MKTRYTIAVAVIAGFGLGGAVVESLHAQAKPPVYLVAEVTVTNKDAYMKEYAPQARDSIKKAGGHFLAVGGKVTSLEGTPAAPRVAVIAWDSQEQVQAYRDSAEFKDVRAIGKKYATFREFTVEGLPQ